jgi:cell division protein FtsW
MRILLFAAIAIIFVLGLVMVFNTSAAEVLDRSLNRNIHHALFRQASYACIGFVLGLIIWRIGYDHLLKMAPLLFLCSLVLLLIVLIPGLGQARGGARRWIALGPLSFQPSEFVKLFMLFFYIESYLLQRAKSTRFFDFAKTALLSGIAIVLVMVEPDNGTAFVMAVSLIPLFFLSPIKMRLWLIPLMFFLIIGACCAYQLPYVRGRIQVYLDPTLDIRGKGHQPHQAKIALGSGKVFGRGPGGSLQKMTYLPEAQNDYIAAIYAEEFGFLGMLALLLLYMIVAYAGFAIALESKTSAGAYVATSITFLISIQAFLNLAVVSGLLPSKGVNLPFFSQGGSSLIANIVAVVLLLNVGRKEVKAIS